MLTGNRQIITFMTLAELDWWALERDWGTARRAALEQHLEQFIIYPSTHELCCMWAVATVGARRNGRQIAAADAWRAALALLHDLPLVTNNAADYLGVPNLRLLTAGAG